MEIKQYNVIVTQQNNEEFVFSYDIIPSPITELWAKATIPAVFHKSNLVYFNHMNCNNTPQDILNQLNYNCNIVNTEGVVTIMNVPESYEDCTREFLNDLHKTFHENYEQFCFHSVIPGSVVSSNTSNTCDALLNLNNLIHTLDDIVEHDTHFNMIKMNFENDHLYERDFSADLYPYFNYSMGVIGDLRLGYATLGKTLHACYLENDMNVIKEKMVRPQIVITSEVYLIFDNTTEEYQKTTGAQLYQIWCRDNNVYAYGYDPLDPQHKYTGRPLLGKLNTDVDINFVKNTWCGCKSVRIEIE